MYRRQYVACFLVCCVLSADLVVSELISTGIAAVSAVAFSGFLAGYGYFKCQYYECCEDLWIPANISGLKYDLQGRLYGQHLVIDTVVRALRSHLSNKNPKKALTLSFHGWTGGGKNYVSRMIAENLYKKGMRSNYVHLFISSFHFPHAEKVDDYKLQRQLHEWINGNVTRCARSLFIFDELDKMSPGVLDAIKPYLETHEELHGVDYRKSIFLFLSNTGGNDITQRTLEHWQKGNLRESIQLPEMEEIINVAAFNEEGLCLRDHQCKNKGAMQRLCIADYFKGRHLPLPTEEQTRRILEMLQYFPKQSKMFSSSGCKRVAQKVDLLLEEEADERDEL